MGDDRIGVMLNSSGHRWRSERPSDQHRCKNATEEAADQRPYLNHALKITSLTHVDIVPDQAL